MAKLEWDKIGERFYETGVDHGVLYVPNVQGEYDNGFSWNGLTSIDESFGDDSTQASYFDGVKINDSYPNGDFSGTINAYTYPDEFLEFEGLDALGYGLYADDQATKVFGLSYRTLIGSDTAGQAEGYKIHLLYNLTATPDSATFQNGSNPSDPVSFSWVIDCVPEKASPYKPTGHIILDSRYLNAEVLQSIEEILYGKDSVPIVLDGLYPSGSGPDVVDGGTPGDPGSGTSDGNETSWTESINPRLPSLSELIDLVTFWDPKIIVATPSTGLSPLISGTGDLTQIKIVGIYSALPTTHLVKTSVPGFYQLN